MAQYKVPQDVEADDKLIGPFSFRQFVYLMIIGGLVAIGFVLFQIFPLLIIILIPPILLLGALALPLKKDQPMETYLSAVVSYYMKPHNRLWEPGEPESTIIITAPKKVDEIHLKDISQEEATHRLSFLADIVDTEGYAIKGQSTNSGVKAEVFAEASNATDIFENTSNNFSQSLNQSTETRHSQLVDQMRNAIEKNNQMTSQNATIVNHSQQQQQQQPNYQQMPQQPTPQSVQLDYYQPVIPQQPVQQTYNPGYPQQPTNYVPAEPTAPVATVSPLPQYNEQNIQQAVPDLPTPSFVEDAMQHNPLDDRSVNENSNIIKPDMPIPEELKEQIVEEQAPQMEYVPADVAERIRHQDDDDDQSSRIDQSSQQTAPSQDIIDLANNSDFSIETIAQQAKRINEQKKDNEVYISLH